jgi:hypothetical protein
MQGYTDFAKVAFTISTTDGRKVTVQADRCGGNNSQASKFCHPTPSVVSLSWLILASVFIPMCSCDRVAG